MILSHQVDPDFEEECLEFQPPVSMGQRLRVSCPIEGTATVVAGCRGCLRLPPWRVLSVLPWREPCLLCPDWFTRLSVMVLYAESGSFRWLWEDS